jgi:hypothetical protein
MTGEKNLMTPDPCRRTLWNVVRKRGRSGYLEDSDERQLANSEIEKNNANLISDLGEDNKHYPVIDLDIPCRLLESSTPGHFHLYIDKAVPNWFEYLALLSQMVKCGLVEEQFYKAASRRGMAFVRRPQAPKKGSTGDKLKDEPVPSHLHYRGGDGPITGDVVPPWSQLRPRS